MSDCSPLRLADSNGNSSTSQSIGSHDSQSNQPPHNRGSTASARRPRTHGSENAHSGIRTTRSASESSSDKSQLQYGAKNVIELVVPVSFCMLIVVGTMKATDGYRYSPQTAIWYAQMMFTDQTVDTGTRVWQSLANALIMLVLIVVMTTILILLYKFRFYKLIHGWLILSSLVLLFMFAIMYVAEILKVYNIPMDNYTLAFLIWNFGVIGMICIHWKGPLLLQQAYLIAISSLLALVFIRSLPDWTTWTVLVIVSIWDLIAVLCPHGPLRILVELAHERNEPIFPALIYSSTMIWEICATTIITARPMLNMADSGDNPRQSTSSNYDKNNKRNRAQARVLQQGIDSQQSPTSRRSAGRRGQLNSLSSSTPAINSPSKRNQHPVEIQYEDTPQTPEVVFVQPANMGNNSNVDEDGWSRPIVRSIGNQRPPNARSQQIDGSRAVIETNTTDLSINLHSSNEGRAEIVEEERGVKLGLGDFIFYSLLVGKASSYGDWTITISCYVAILIGLCLILSLLAIFRKALPALPISIAFGLVALFLSYIFVVPFANRLAVEQVFV